MKRTQRLIRNSLLALVISSALVVLATGAEASAKARDKIGEDPTDSYDAGRGAQLQDTSGPAYIPGIGFEIGAIIKFHQEK